MEKRVLGTLSTHRTVAQFAVLAVVLFALSPAAIGADVRNCERLLASFREIEVTMKGALEEVQRYRSEAQKMASWYGMEEFEPYIITLRDQEEKLQSKLEEIRRTRCEPSLPDPQ